MPSPHPLAPVTGDNQVLRMAIFWIKAKYDFAVDGGLIGPINLLPDAGIVNDALLIGAYINIITPPVGGAATLALGAESTTDINAAVVVTGAPWDTTGFKAADLALGSSPSKLTLDRNLVATIAVANLTAGEFEVLLAYLPPGL